MNTVNNEEAARTLQRRNDEIRLLFEAGRQLGRTLDLEEIYDILHDTVSQIMPCTTLVVSNFDRDEQMIYCAYARHRGRRQDVSHLPPLPLNPEGSDTHRGTQSRAIRTGDALLVADWHTEVKNDPRAYYLDEEGNILDGAPVDARAFTQSGLIVPMKLEGTVTGVLQVMSNEKGVYDESDLHFLETLASQIAAARANALLYRQAQQEIAERQIAEAAEREQRVLAEALADTAAILNRTLDLDEVLHRILEQVGRVVAHEGANVMLIDGGIARVRRYHGYHEQYPISSSLLNYGFDLQQAVTLRSMVRSRQATVIADTHTFQGWLATTEGKWVRSYAGAPIIQEDEVIGFLNLDASTPNFFTAVHAERLQAFAAQVSVALHNAQLYEALEHYRDFLERAVSARTAELQRTVDQMNAIVDHSPQAIILMNPGGAIERGNPAVEALFGYDPVELRALTVEALVAPEDSERFTSALQTALSEGTGTRLQLTACRKDGTIFDADVALVPTVDGEQVGSLICSMHDISGLKEVERMKDAFVSNVSHELRTPISSLKLYHGLLARDPGNQTSYMAGMEREIDRLNVVIEDLLRLSRLEQGRVELQLKQSDLLRLVLQHVIDRRPLAERSNLSLWLDDTQTPAPVFIDESLIGQVFSILLTNALNYTPPGGKIQVGFCHKEQDLEEFCGFYVKDNGPGIAPEDQSQLFQRFFRGQVGRKSGAGGTGLGLSIAEEIVRQHHGHIGVESEGIVGCGTTFRVWLPLAKSQYSMAQRRVTMD